MSAVQADEYWQQFVHYTMDITLDTANHDIHGESSIMYVNQSPDSLDQIYMHLYPNAFKEGSVKYREFSQNYGRLGRIAAMMTDMDPYESGINIHDFLVKNEEEHTGTQFKIDDTILSSKLPNPLAPYDTLTIDMKWTHHVGEMIERAGRIGNQYNMAQWYPKIVVYDEKGWHADPFHAEGEFYGEFGTFDVTLDLPKGYIVGATGTVVQGDPGWNDVAVDTTQLFSAWLSEYKHTKTTSDSTQRRVVTFHAEDVHDFAWITSPTFLYEHDEWNGIDIHILYNEDNGEDWSRVVRERSLRALKWLSTKFGAYQYPQVTVTDRPPGGGMEYPMLAMNGSNSESLIVHEIGHIWFYGMLGNNEIDESWLDEGFTTFQTRWYMETRYPPSGNDLSLNRYKPYQKKYWRFTPWTDHAQWSTIRFQQSGRDEPISRASYLFDSGRVYRQNAYIKPSLMLNELRYVMGDSLFLVAMQTYFDRWKLKHVNEERFIAIAEEVCEEELGWFFNAWLHDTQQFDIALCGWDKKNLEDGIWEVTVDLRQKGNRFLPVEIETIFKDGTTSRTWWKNHLWCYEDTFNYSVSKEPMKIVLDPDKMTVDADRRNNQSGRMKRERMFRRPGMTYNPIDAYVVQWSPLLYFHEQDGYRPGIRISRKYGHYESLDLKLTTGVKSKDIGWAFSGHRNAMHYSAFDENDISGLNLYYTKNWSPKYGIDPKHKWMIGLYAIHADKNARTNLYEAGDVAVVYGSHAVNMRGSSWTTSYATTPGGLSDWIFSRLTSELRVSHSQGIVEYSNRLLGGVSWADKDGIPAQERFTVEGAGSGDAFQKTFLRDESAFFGLTELKNHYHLPGDANLRGYYGMGYAGVESVVSNTFEVTVDIPVQKVSLELAGFADAAIFWGSRWEEGDNKFDGDILADAGIGIRIQKNILGYPLALRIDAPFWLSEPGDSEPNVDFNRWIFSLEKSF